jgi:hypothetical protein
MEAKLMPFSQDSFDKDDQHFRTITSLIQLIDKNSFTFSAAEGTIEAPTKNILKYLAISSFIIAWHCEVVAAIPEYSGKGLKVFVCSPQSDTSFDEHSLLVTQNPVKKRDPIRMNDIDKLDLDRVILCKNETLKSENIDSSITEYICNNWYVDRVFAIFP